MSASGGCPPYNWSLSGGGTLTPSGGGNTSATYVAPATNPNCVNNPIIQITDCCGNYAQLQLAISCSENWVAGEQVQWSSAGTRQCGIYPNITIYMWSRSYKFIMCDGSLVTPEDPNYGSIETLESDPPTSYYDVRCVGGDTTPPLCVKCSDLGKDHFGSGIFGQGFHGSYDTRSAYMKSMGCCPINPSTGLPFDDWYPDSEERGKNAGQP